MMSYDSLLKEVPYRDKIPKQVFQVYHSADLPEALLKNIEVIKKLLPGWKYRFFTDTDIEEYLEAHAPGILPFYNKIDPEYGAAKADLFRYVIVYLEGGLYLDIKSTLSRTIPEDYLQSRMYISHWERKHPASVTGLHPEIDLPKGEFQQWFLLAPPGHPAMRGVVMSVLQNMRTYNPFRQGVGKLAVLRTTGPIAFTLALRPMMDLDSIQVVNSRQDLGLKYSIYSQKVSRDHEVLFQKHYSTSRRPVIRPFTLRNWVINVSFVLGQRIKNGLRALHLVK